MNRKNILIACLLVLLFVIIFVISDYVSNEKQNNAKRNLLTGKYYAEINIKNYGTIKVELDADNTPITVTNFVDLVNKKFYDGLTFHRIMNDFMIQGGDPEANGLGGSGTNILGEFESNGIKNNISHVRGVISMARGSYSMNSASSQFFIVQKDSTHLDGNYAAFGHVIEGMDIVDEIAKNTKVEDDNGTVLIENQPIIENIRMIEKEDK